jgi:hypothetical protein
MAASLKRASSDRVSLSQAEPFWPSGNSIKLETFLGQQTKQYFSYFSLRLRRGDGRKAPKSL